jgi:hypothetical protein
MKIALVSMMLLGTIALGCGAANGPPKSPDEEGYLTFRGARFAQYKVTKDDLISPEVQLHRAEGVFRGTIGGGKIIEMRLEGNKISGQRAGQPIDLKVEASATSTEIIGYYAGKKVWLHFATGVQDDCQTPLQIVAEGDESKVPACGTNQETISVPKVLQSLPKDQQAAFIVAALYR